MSGKKIIKVTTALRHKMSNSNAFLWRGISCRVSSHEPSLLIWKINMARSPWAGPSMDLCHGNSQVELFLWKVGFKETMVPRRWTSETLKFSIKRPDKRQIFTVSVSPSSERVEGFWPFWPITRLTVMCAKQLRKALGRSQPDSHYPNKKRYVSIPDQCKYVNKDQT